MSHAQSYATNAYAASARNGMSLRELEASALLKAAARLQTARDDHSPADPEFDAALTHNRRLWTVLAAALSDPASAMPDDLKARLLTLANFVFNHTLTITAAPTPDKLTSLIAINRDLAAGLRAAG
ncbi:MAG: flagellar biosynthesis regulator FlaF [Proteobacteria bacterium]|nr:flagellar biosynthesis regulator FlaF [Pseudomonadota bacterium]